MLTLETLVGPLAKTVPQFKEGTIRTSAELTTERRDNEELRHPWLWTANFAMYLVEKGDVVLYLGGRKANPLFNNLKEVTNQLIYSRNYTPTPAEISAVKDSVQSGETLQVRLSELNLQGENNEFRHIEINTGDYSSLHKSKRALAEMAYGKGDDSAQNMDMFVQAGIMTTKIYVINPYYVTRGLFEGEGLVRLCKLNGFSRNSNFGAAVRDAGYPDDALRGEPIDKK